MKGSRIATRRRASEVPEIAGIRLVPVGGEATLLNISTSGVLVDCASRVAPGMPLTVVFEGTFTPSSITGRVVRCEVASIRSDSSLRYHLGLAFNKRLDLREEEAPVANESAASPLPAAVVPASAAPTVLRNRW